MGDKTCIAHSQVAISAEKPCDYCHLFSCPEQLLVNNLTVCQLIACAFWDASFAGHGLAKMTAACLSSTEGMLFASVCKVFAVLLQAKSSHPAVSFLRNTRYVPAVEVRLFPNTYQIARMHSLQAELILNP